MTPRMISIISWLLVLWITKIFITSLFYKFSGHPDTVYIFSTIGQWLQSALGQSLSTAFSQYGAYVVGTWELITSLVLLAPAFFWLWSAISGSTGLPQRSTLHFTGGLMASAVMAGAVFFHLASPLGVEVMHQGKPDGGSLFYAAVSILVSGIILAILNRK